VKPLIFVDCEAYGGAPATGRLTEFGAVKFDTKEFFHGKLMDCAPSEANSAIRNLIREMSNEEYLGRLIIVFTEFNKWLLKVCKNEKPIFVSDNPAFDWQWINDGFFRTMNMNPFGHSARRIGDFYAGTVGNFRATQKWKRWRRTKHNHNPVNDAMGNVKAFERILLLLKKREGIL
jgi:hypothetical protein